MDNPTPGEPKAAANPDVSPTGAAAAKAPEPRPDDSQPPKRRSDRVLVAIPIDLTATDLQGERFTESCFTEMVSLHGASLALPRRISLEHPVVLRRNALDVQVQARVLGQIGIRPGLHLYGIAFTEDSSHFWGIHFPAPDTTEGALGRTLLMCSECGMHLIFTLTEIEFRVFEANQRLTFGCENCARNVSWMPVPVRSPAARSGDGGLGNRKHSRTTMKTSACIQESGYDDDIVEVLNISRGGISFRSPRAYEVNSWIQFAVPYTPGAANIFVSGRVAWRKGPLDDYYEHGVQYVRG